MGYETTMNCDACLTARSFPDSINHVGADHGPSDRRFTFILVYGSTPGDEIDILAKSYDQALALATQVAELEYEPGYEIRSTTASGGSVW